MHALQCDGCCGWQHRKCKTGVSSAEYKLLCKGELDLSWYCKPCSEPVNPIPEMSMSSILSEMVEEEPREGMSMDTCDATSTAHSVNLDRSFNVSLPINHPPQILDASLAEPEVDDVILDPEINTVTFTEVEGGSQRGGRKLASSDGFTYVWKRGNARSVVWTCSVQRKNIRCAAHVKQFDDVYIRGSRQHSHPANPGAAKNTILQKMVRY